MKTSIQSHTIDAKFSSVLQNLQSISDQVPSKESNTVRNYLNRESKESENRSYLFNQTAEHRREILGSYNNNPIPL